MFLLWLQFLACSALILAGGTRLLVHAEAIARHTGLGGSWIGMALLATVTSLPELVSGAAAITQAQAPDIALGDVLGSCVINLAMIARVDMLATQGSAFGQAGRSHLLAGAFGIACLACIGTWLAVPPLAPGWSLPAWLLAIVLVALYAVALRSVFMAERLRPRDDAAPQAAPGSLARAVAGYVMAAAVVVGAAIWLPLLAVDLSAAMAWSQGFVGTLFVALTTSLPELAVTLAAVRRRAIDLAIGNLLGSNLFNMVVLAIDIGLWWPRDLMASASTTHLVSVLSAILMSAAVMVALSTPPRQRLLNAISWLGVLLVLGLFVNLWLHLKLAP